MVLQLVLRSTLHSTSACTLGAHVSDSNYCERTLGRCLQALLGRAKVLELKKQLPTCLDVLTEINVRFSWFVPALVEKTRLLVQLNDWDQATEHIQRILAADPQNIMAQAWHCKSTTLFVARSRGLCGLHGQCEEACTDMGKIAASSWCAERVNS